jgi:hypothetical protein
VVRVGQWYVWGSGTCGAVVRGGQWYVWGRTYLGTSGGLPRALLQPRHYLHSGVASLNYIWACVFIRMDEYGCAHSLALGAHPLEVYG